MSDGRHGLQHFPLFWWKSEDKALFEKSDAERIRRLEGELQATSAKYREMANMMAYWRSRCIAYEKMLVESSRKAGAEK